MCRHREHRREWTAAGYRSSFDADRDHRVAHRDADHDEPITRDNRRDQRGDGHSRDSGSGRDADAHSASQATDSNGAVVHPDADRHGHPPSTADLASDVHRDGVAHADQGRTAQCYTDAIAHGDHQRQRDAVANRHWYRRHRYAIVDASDPHYDHCSDRDGYRRTVTNSDFDADEHSDSDADTDGQPVRPDPDQQRNCQSLGDERGRRLTRTPSCSPDQRRSPWQFAEPGSTVYTL